MPNDIKVTLRMPEEIRDRITEIAAKERRSMGSQVVMILERAVKDYLEKQRQEAASMKQ